MTSTKLQNAAENTARFLKGRTPRNRRWQLDVPYWGDLTPAEKLWMGQFLSEYYNGQIRKGDAGAIHKTDEHRRECYNRAKSADRDAYAIHACSKRLSYRLFDLDFYIYTRLWKPQFQARSTNKGRGRNGFF